MSEELHRLPLLFLEKGFNLSTLNNQKPLNDQIQIHIQKEKIVELSYSWVSSIDDELAQRKKVGSASGVVFMSRRW